MKQFTLRKEYETFSTKTFRIPVEFDEALKKLADSHNTSVNKVVIQCLDFALKNIDQSEFGEED